MDFTINMMDSTKGIPTSQATIGTIAAYQAHQASIAHQANAAHQTTTTNHSTQQHQRNSIHEETTLANESKLQELTKEDSEGAFTPPSRIASVSHQESRAEKGTDTTDFAEPVIKVEIRGSLPGLNLGTEKDKNSIIQLHFNSPNEVLHYFSQRTVPHQLDAFNLLANPDLVRNINPELVRNHFLYVPSTQEPSRISSNGYSGSSSSAATPPAQNGAQSSIIVTNNNLVGTKTIKQERRRGDVPPGTIIHRNVQLEPLPNQFVCWMCGLDLQKSLPFEEHMVDQHSVDKPYKCDECGVTFKRKAHLDRHRRIHLPTRPYQCGVCGKGFTRNEHVRRHAFTHSGEKPFNCPTCGKTFSRREHLSKHHLSHTKAGPHSPTTTSHSQTAGLATTLLLQATDQNGRILTINQAGTGIPVSSSSVVSPSASSTHGFHASANSGSTSTTGSSSGHSRTQNGEPVSRPYQCGVCGKAFIRNEHLRRHVLTHSGEKPHVCSQCGKAFSRREHLTKHIRSHNKGNTSASGGMPSSSSALTVSHAGIQVTSGTVSSAGSQVSMGNQGIVSTGISSAVPTASTNNQPAHSASIAHSLGSSHTTPVAHPTHLPPGTHYLPMFSLLAEVV